MKNKRYVMADHRKCVEDYQKNLQKMLTIGGQRYIRTERRLNTLNTKIMKDLGIYLFNPCPISRNQECYDCTGFTKRVPDSTKKKQDSKKSVMCEEDDEEAIECPLRGGGL